MLELSLTMGVFCLHQDGCLQGFPIAWAGWRFGCPPSRGYPSSIYPRVLADPPLLGITLLPPEARVDTLWLVAC